MLQEVLKESIPNTSGSVVANDNKTVFYTSKNKVTLLSEKMFGTARFWFEKDILVYRGKKTMSFILVYTDQNLKFIIIWNSSTLVSDYQILEASNPNGTFYLLP